MSFSIKVTGATAALEGLVPAWVCTATNLLFWAALYVTAIVFHHLSPENGFDGNAHDEVEPDDVKALQDQQQPIQQPPGPIRPGNLPALNQNTVNNPEGKDDKSTDEKAYAEQDKEAIT